MIDTHTHLYSEEFDEDRHEMIERAIQKGVSKF
jgi:TatD DNase family protein